MTGSIGIGTVSPTARLHISGTTGVLLEADGVNGVNALFVSSSGNVGIGTNNPSDFGAGYTTLGINGSTLGGVLDLMVGGARSLTIATDGSNPSISARISGESILFRTNGGAGSTERMRISSSGNVGIGTSSPSGIFQAGVANAGIYFDTSTQYTPKIIAAGTISDIQIQSVGNGGNVYLNAPGATSLIGMSVNGSERMRITSDGYLRLASNGIQFNGDTAAANSLDDYEEGTYTVAMTSQIGSITLSTDYNTGSYTKIGNRVLFSFRVDVLSVSSPSGQLNISLPFMVSNASPITAYRSVASLFVYDAVSTNINAFSSVIVQNTQNVTILIGNSTTGNDAAAQIKAGTQFHIQGQYVAA